MSRTPAVQTDTRVGTLDCDADLSNIDSIELAAVRPARQITVVVWTFRLWRGNDHI